MSEENLCYCTSLNLQTRLLLKKKTRYFVPGFIKSQVFRFWWYSSHDHGLPSSHYLPPCNKEEKKFTPEQHHPIKDSVIHYYNYLLFSTFLSLTKNIVSYRLCCNTRAKHTSYVRNFFHESQHLTCIMWDQTQRIMVCLL